MFASSLELSSENQSGLCSYPDQVFQSDVHDQVTLAVILVVALKCIHCVLSNVASVNQIHVLFLSFLA